MFNGVDKRHRLLMIVGAGFGVYNNFVCAFRPYLNNQAATRRCRAHFVSVKNAICASTSFPGTQKTRAAKGGLSASEYRSEELCGMGVVETNSFWVYRHLLTIPDRTMNDAICECKEPKKPNEEAS